MEYKNLEKWHDILNKCIRCGYCFENCHIYKITGWETDTPRGKLTMLHGVLQNDIEPTDYLVEKIFECYNCKRCNSACSAKVDVTGLFQDAKMDFIEAGFDVEGTVSGTNPDICSRCKICISVCKHEARSYDEKNDCIVVDKAKCQSCGCCVAACPSGAAYSRIGFGLSQQELLEQLEQYLEGVS